MSSELIDCDSTLNELVECLQLLESDVSASYQQLKEAEPLFHISTEPSPNGEFVSFNWLGTPILHCHPKQKQALETHCRFLLILAGWRSGKSSIGPWWLLNEMVRQGPGNYLSAAPSFKLLDKFPVPNISRYLGRVLGLGQVIGGAMGEFRVSEAGHKLLWPQDRWPQYDDNEPSRIIFGHADNPDSLASFTGKGAWLDEPGQKRFKQDSNEEICARLATTGGRVLYTSRPYVHHWLKTEVYDRADRNRRARKKSMPFNPADDGFEVIEFESIDNPQFDRAIWDQAKLTLPRWKFDMKFRGQFTRPAGAIYDCFDSEFHVLPGKDFKLPDGWPIYCGVDFGAPNFAATFFYDHMHEVDSVVKPGALPTLCKSGRYVAFAEYRPKEAATAAQHVQAMRSLLARMTMAGKPRNPDVCVGGAKSEGQWRSELAAAGWPIWEPDQPDVEVGIQRVYTAISEDRLYVMDTVKHLLDDIQNYSRETDDEGDVIDMTIEDKEMYHSADSMRYIISWLERKTTGLFVGVFK